MCNREALSYSEMVVSGAGMGHDATLNASAGDLSALPSQAKASTRIEVAVPVPAGAATGDYDVYLSAPDIFPATASDPRFAVRFANADSASSGQVWDQTTARFKAGTTLTVR